MRTRMSVYRLAASALMAAVSPSGIAIAQTPYVPPASPRATFNFNPGWKFIREDVTNAEQADFDDSEWADVSLPHTCNDADSYDHIISHSGGDRDA